MLQREEEMLAAVKAANEEVSIMEPLHHIISIGYLDWGIVDYVCLAMFSSLGNDH